MATDDTKLIDEMQATIPQRLQALQEATNPERLAQERAEALAPFGEDGPWKYAPDAEKVAAARKVDDAAAQRAGENLFRLEHETEGFKRQLGPLLIRAQEPPTVEAAYLKRSGDVGISTAQLTSLETLDELRRLRFVGELSGLLPSKLLAVYDAALADPYEQEAASKIRWIEGRHGAGWSGVNVDGNADEGKAKQTLRKRIAETRQARIPEWLRACETVILAAEAEAAATKAHKRVRPQRPANWRVA